MRYVSYGRGFVGSQAAQTSTANLEVVPNPPAEWVNAKYSFYKFKFKNTQACKVKINGENTIYLDAGQGFEIDKNDAQIKSFVVVDAAITFTFVGYY